MLVVLGIELGFTEIRLVRIDPWGRVERRGRRRVRQTRHRDADRRQRLAPTRRRRTGKRYRETRRAGALRFVQAQDRTILDVPVRVIFFSDLVGHQIFQKWSPTRKSAVTEINYFRLIIALVKEVDLNVYFRFFFIQVIRLYKVISKGGW